MMVKKKNQSLFQGTNIPAYFTFSVANIILSEKLASEKQLILS